MGNEPRILLVDDEANLLRSTAKTLLRQGYHVTTAPDNPSALAAWQAAGQNGCPFDLAIVDLNMPDFSGRISKHAGLDLLKRLKTETPRTPIIVNSAWDEVETARLCLLHGAADYFVKGRADDMLQKIRVTLNITP